MSNPISFDVHGYEFLEEVTGAFYSAIGVMRARANETAPLSPLFSIRSGYAESPGWFMVQAAEFEPEPLTVENLRVRDVYGSERIVRAHLELMASEMWFDRNARDEYALTGAGREMLARVFARRRGWLERLARGEGGEAIGDARLETRVVEQRLRALLDASAGTWCLDHSRRRAHLQETTLLGKIFQYLEDFNAFRDDAHMAAWQPLGLTGHAWETFAFVYDGQATNVDALFEALHHRGFTRAEYAATLDALTARGWLERGDGENFRVTAHGRAVRADAEQKTDTFFFAPWQGLAEPKLVELRMLMEALRDALLALV